MIFRCLCSNFHGVIMINEIQLMPDIFAVLRVLVDQKKERTFIILGSASDVLVTHSGETLAGRVGFIEFLTQYERV